MIESSSSVEIFSQLFHSAKQGQLSEDVFWFAHTLLLDAKNDALAHELWETWHLCTPGMAERDILDTHVTAEHLQRVTDPMNAKILFRRSVKRIYLEISSYCNRRCTYCPNALIDRISEKKFLPETILRSIFDNLGSIQYNGALFFHCYNEPLADPDLCEKIALSKQYCPNVQAMLYSNGDYINRDYLEKLHAVGLSHLTISLHSNNGLWSESEVQDRLDAISRRLGLALHVEYSLPGQQMIASLSYKFPIRVMIGNYLVNGSNRGNLMPQIVTYTNDNLNRPCQMPFEDMYIAWDGSILPCCHLHADAPEHQAFKIGNIADFQNLFEAYANSALVDWRRSVIAPTMRRPPCDTCIQTVHDERVVTKMRNIYQQAIVTL
ncbi:MAG: SPASM domain-containing protein [Magnetococcus sp. YQC-9]